jgi:ABC-type Fe3+/spermidine/putrescine transport system ATPase subunit
VQQVGTPEEVYRHPANRFVAEFVGRVNLIDGVVATSGDGSVVLDVAGERRLTVAGDGARVSDAVTVAVRPEAMTLVPTDDATFNGTNTWEADVHTVAFLGDHYEYELSAGRVELTAQSSRRVDGARLKVHIPPDACSVVG